METAENRQPKIEPSVQKKISRRNFISFTTFIAAGAAAFGGWKWLYNSPVETPGVTAGTIKPLRRALNSTELFFRKLYSNNHLVKTYPKSMAASNVRTNSFVGINDNGFSLAGWQLQIKKGLGDVLNISLDDLKKLPKTEIVYSFKCVEGWDQIQCWAGVKFADVIAHYQLESFAKMNYVGMETPNGEYYVGLDMESAMHPQTLLAYEMNDQPITLKHGAPVRLIIPVKYGIKNLKRIGTISFSNFRPRDYWAEQGYDYYSGL